MSLTGDKPRATAAGKRGLREARRAMYRRALLDAAERVFAERGYDGTRMQDVASQAGIALGTVYGVIDGKEELYATIHRVRGRELLEHAARAASEATSAIDALLRGVGAYVRFLAEHPHYLRIHLKESQPWALGPRWTSEEQRVQWREGLELTVAVFRAGIAEGSIVDEDPERLARLMIAAHQVYLVEWVEEGMRRPAAELIQAMQGHLCRSFLKAPTPPDA